MLRYKADGQRARQKQVANEKKREHPSFLKEYAEKFTVIHVNEGLSREQVEMMKYAYAPDLQSAVNQAAIHMPNADVVILPSGGNAIPEVRKKG
jgi:hypothetical protein